MEITPTSKKPNETKRVFNINKENNFINLEDSYLLINNQISKEEFQAEIYKVSFSTVIKGKLNTYDLFLSANELITDEDRTALKEALGIEIIGEGSSFEIINFNSDFSIQFDQENSSFINTPNCTNGCIYFKK